jgi:TatD DNase family protein
MHLPQRGDYIDIHNHGGVPAPGIFILETLMAHEGRTTLDVPGIAYTYGIHPWFLQRDNYRKQIESVRENAENPAVLAIGEAGFDKLRGADPDLQRSVFEEQVEISEMVEKPVVIHCVRAWDDLLSVHKRMKPKMPWLIHGFRGNVEQAVQLLSKGMYLSFWFNFILRPESAKLIRAVPDNRIFLETDGSDAGIKEIYKKVSLDKGIETEELKSLIYSNFISFFASFRHVSGM